VSFVPGPVAFVGPLGAIRFVPGGEPQARPEGGFDVLGAVTMTAAMLLLVFTLVEAPSVGWGSARTLGSLAAVAAILAAFVARERRTAAPLVRLGIFRNSTLVRANFAAMALAAWIGFQFIATLYMQQLRGWSSLETGLAIFPAGALVAVLSPRVGTLIHGFGGVRLTVPGLLSLARP